MRRSAGQEPTSLSASERRRLRRLAARLTAWYRENRRDLPWRRKKDAYAIWVSEVMLQQTRVEAVIDRYERFLRRFPTLERLAAAPGSEVLAEWAGLGYYRRARQLHDAARRIVEDHGGKFPSSAAALSLLPGFGRYTAGAVASIAFGESTPAVDGNVERVVSRLLGLDLDPKRGEGAATVRRVATAFLADESPGELNQALMELGALVCTPRAPRCDDCVWRRSCAARQSGMPESFPRLAPRRAAEPVACYAAVMRDGERLLFRRRPEGGHNAGLWELPTTEWHPGDPDPARAAPALAELGRALGARWDVGDRIARARHGVTHHRVQVDAHEVRGSADGDAEHLRFATPEEAPSLGLSAATTKLLARLPSLL